MTERPCVGRYRVGIDIGGTFTDVVIVAPDGAVTPVKILSTPDDYSRAVADGLKRILSSEGIAPTGIEELVHGTTVATNAILEKRGARTALITTAGFRDVLEIRRVRMPQLYNIQWEKPKPLVPRFLRFEVAERVDAHGEVIQPLDEGRLQQIAGLLRDESVEAVAICLINAYLNPVHEQRIAAILRDALPTVSLSVSSDITRELKEFERTSTTVIDAYVKPVVDRYLGSLETSLRSLGVDSPLLVMQSNGAVMSVDAARESPCFLIESGPAAGAIAGRALAQRSGEPNLITFDMGGTTAKAALIEQGEAGLTDEYEVGAGITVGTRLMKGDGYLLRIPAIDLAEVGAGGGSIAWIDAGGRLQVGPESAGASPGPACYGQGGNLPTVTDANVLLGYIDPELFAGRSVRIDPDLAWRAIEPLSRKLGSTPLDTALAIHVVSNARMSRAIRAVTVERGLDVRDFALLAFGGSGPIHAANLAEELGIRRILIPPYAGLFSALGLSLANAGHVLVRTYKRRLDTLPSFELLSQLAALQDELRRRLAALSYPAGDLRFESAADMRYAGQQFNLTVDLSKAIADPAKAVEQAKAAFVRLHERTYGHSATSDPIEVVNLRLRAWVDTSRTWPNWTDSSVDHVAPFGKRDMSFRGADGRSRTTIVTRGALSEAMAGPLAIQEPDTTIIVPPGWRASLDDLGNVRLERGGQDA